MAFAWDKIVGVISLHTMKIDANTRSVDLDPRETQFYQNPYPAYHAIREACPVFKWGQYGHWCFATYEDVSALLRDRRFGRQILHVATREELGWADTPEHLKPFAEHEQHSLLELEPPVHTRLRGLVNRAFLSRQVERLRPEIIRFCNELIDKIDSRSEFDLLPAYATPIPLRIICDLLGAPASMANQFLAWSHDHVGMYMARRNRVTEDKAVTAVTEFSHYMRELIRERRTSPHSDLLSELVRASDGEGKLSEEELITTAILLMNAGHEATVHSLGNAVKTLLENNHRGPVTPALVDETLRFDPPLHMFTRYALEDLEYGGIKLKKGELVGLLLGAANRDPHRFKDPDHFEPIRNPNPHVSFGAGIHFCVGAPLARLELEIGLQTLFERMPNLKIARAVIYSDKYHFHGCEQLFVSKG
jgi:cytochrome P450